jgi:hypothetical protein
LTGLLNRAVADSTAAGVAEKGAALFNQVSVVDVIPGTVIEE